MGEVSTIGLDLAKSVLQVDGADASGTVLFGKKLRRHQVLTFFAGQPPCTVAMEACGRAHHWAREISKLAINRGSSAELIAPEDLPQWKLEILAAEYLATEICRRKPTDPSQIWTRHAKMVGTQSQG